MNILLTGSAGFIGSCLAKRLLEGHHRVYGVDNFYPNYDPGIKKKNIQGLSLSPNFQFFQGDILHLSKLKLPTIDMVLHFAALPGISESVRRPHEVLKNNILGTNNVIQFMKMKNIKKILFSSSSSVYGNNPPPFHEDMNISRSLSPYAMSKQASENLLFSYHHNFEIDVLILRFFSVYGPGQRPDLVLSRFTDNLLCDKEITMNGDGSIFRDFTFITDIVDGIEKGIEFLKVNDSLYEIINLGNGKSETIMNLLKLVSELLNKKPILKFDHTNKDNNYSTLANIGKARELLSYNPQISIDEGVRKYLKWRELL